MKRNDQLAKVLEEVKVCAETGSALALGPGAVHNLWLAIQALGNTADDVGTNQGAEELASRILLGLTPRHPELWRSHIVSVLTASNAATAEPS